jgi:hypothetical protein
VSLKVSCNVLWPTSPAKIDSPSLAVAVWLSPSSGRRSKCCDSSWFILKLFKFLSNPLIQYTHHFFIDRSPPVSCNVLTPQSPYRFDPCSSESGCPRFSVMCSTLSSSSSCESIMYESLWRASMTCLYDSNASLHSSNTKYSYSFKQISLSLLFWNGYSYLIVKIKSFTLEIWRIIVMNHHLTKDSIIIQTPCMYSAQLYVW